METVTIYIDKFLYDTLSVRSILLRDSFHALIYPSLDADFRSVGTLQENYIAKTERALEGIDYRVEIKCDIPLEQLLTCPCPVIRKLTKKYVEQSKCNPKAT
jgi:hypothetical protein